MTKPIMLMKTCYKLLYVIQVTSLIGDFLASADIKAFGCTYVGRAASYWPNTFLHPGCFCLAFKYTAMSHVYFSLQSLNLDHCIQYETDFIDI